MSKRLDRLIFVGLIGLIGKLAFLLLKKKNRNVRLTRLGSTIRLNPFIEFLAYYTSYDYKLNL